MSLLDKIKDMVGQRKGIDRLSVDELKQEKIRLEQMERRVSREVDNTEARKHDLFLKGKDETSSRQQLALARKIKELDARARSKGQQLAFFHKHLRIIDGLLQIKENMELLKELKVGSVITNMSVEELTGYVEQATVQGQFEMEKFTGLLESLEGAMEAGEEAEEDADLKAIVAAMEEARAAEEAGRPEGIDAAAKQVDELLSKEREAVRGSVAWTGPSLGSHEMKVDLSRQHRPVVSHDPGACRPASRVGSAGRSGCRLPRGGPALAPVGPIRSRFGREGTKASAGQGTGGVRRQGRQPANDRCAPSRPRADHRSRRIAGADRRARHSGGRKLGRHRGAERNEAPDSTGLRHGSGSQA